MSVLSYNGLTFPMNQTTDFSCWTEYDPVGKTDPYMTVYKIEGTCLINKNLIDVITANLSGADLALVSAATNAPDLVRRLRSIFSKPRKRLSFIVGGVEQIPRSSAVSGTIDSANGPHPERFKEVYITQDTILLSIAITARYWENPVAVGSLIEDRATSPVLYNRWTESNSIDHRNLVTRTREGEFRIRSDNSQNKTADQLRPYFAQLSIPDEFLRKKREYTLSPDGLTLKYHVVDEEQIQMPPTASTGHGTYSADVSYEETTGKSHVTRFGRVTVSLEGGKAIAPEDLYLTAIGIAVNKIFIVADEKLDGKKSDFIPIGSRTQYDTYSNRVSFTLQVQYTKTKKRIGGIWGLAKSTVSNSIRFQGVPLYDVYGEASLLMEAANYYDPNFVNNGLKQESENPVSFTTTPGGYQMNRGKTPGTAGGGE